MGSWEYELREPPADARSLELWLQHAAGFILFEDVRREAAQKIDPGLPAETRAAVQKGIDDAVYGLMQVIDGVSGTLRNSTHEVRLDCRVRLVRAVDGYALSEVDLHDGDGMCMEEYHGWREGDFGRDPIAQRRDGADA